MRSSASSVPEDSKYMQVLTAMKVYSHCQQHPATAMYIYIYIYRYMQDLRLNDNIQHELSCRVHRITI